MIDNNKFMGAVDRCEQMVAYSCFRRHNEMVEESVFPLVFLDNLECLHSVQGRNPITCPTQKLLKRTCERANNKLWHFSLSYSKGPSKEVSSRFDTSPSWISFPRENTGHWEEGQHHPILRSLFS